jgi:BspA type Leucine rich repeat region (6 copies)
MSKTFIRILVAFGIGMLWLIAPAFAQSPFTYTVNNGAVTITGYAQPYPPPGPLIIPATLNGLPVTEVAGFAFYQNNSITSAVIGNNVTNVGPHAFDGCGLISSLTIGNSVMYIGDGAFNECSLLPSVNMGSNVTWIGPAAFSLCDGLRWFTVPAGVTNIGELAFAGCPFLTGIYFAGNMPILESNAIECRIYYQPGTTGWPQLYEGITTIAWNPQIQSGGTNFGLGTNGFRFDVTGLSNMWFSVDACTNLAGGNWMPIQTNRFTNVTFHFDDPQATNYGARFYRLQMP